jgi:methionyl-tRNA formyltransferase
LTEKIKAEYKEQRMTEVTGLKILFLGTSSFAVPSLRVLSENIRQVAVVTRPDRPAGRGRRLSATPVKEEALKYNLELFQPDNHEGLLQVLQTVNPQVLVNVAFGMFLKPAVLNFPPMGCINLHPSLLPAYRGAAPIQRALMAGEKSTGVTVLYMTSRLDAGDIIMQEKTEIDPEENFGELHDRLAELGSKVLLKALELVAQGKAPRQPQEEDKATFAPPITREEEAISWSKPAVSIHNLVRSLNPVPGAYTGYRGKRLKVWRTSLAEKSPESPAVDRLSLPPGAVCSVGKDYAEVVTGQNTLKLLEVQLEGKRRMSMEDFLKGYSMKVGERFE